MQRTIQRLAGSFAAPTLRARQDVRWELRRGEPELRLVNVLRNPTRDFLDVGANKGVYAFHAIGRYRKVVAVEAHPGMVTGLRRIIKPKNEVLPVALSDKTGETVLHVPTRNGRDVFTRSSLQEDANPGFKLRAVDVPMTTIDELRLGDIGVLKIDVEGHETAVLHGGASTIRTWKPTCIVECEERHNAGGIARTFDFFDSLGYRGFFLHRGVLRDGSDFDAAALQRPEDAKSVGGGRSADYVNNFIFVHKDRDSDLMRIRRAYN